MCFLCEICAIYSQNCVSESGSLTFDQIPFFETAERLQAENDDLRSAKGKLEARIDATEVQLANLLCPFAASSAYQEERLRSDKKAQEALLKAESCSCRIAELKDLAEELQRSKKKSEQEGNVIKSELVRLRTENLKLKDSLEEMKQENADLKVCRTSPLCFHGRQWSSLDRKA